MKDNYIPDRCDVVWIDFDPQVGHEQAGRRPAFISHLNRIIQKLVWQ